MHDKTGTIVLVGGLGFIGQAVYEILVHRGFNVVVVDDLSAPVASVLTRFPNIRLIRKDVADLCPSDISGLEHAVWIYLAAVAYIPDTFSDPIRTVHTNIAGVLRACRLAVSNNARRFVLISSSEVYGSVAAGTQLTELSPTRPQSLYAISKLMGETVVREFVEIPSVIVRPFNAYGPYETHPYFVPDMISQAKKGAEIRVGNLESGRDFTYVSDTAEGIFKAAVTEGIDGETINLSSGNACRMSDLLALIQESCGTRSANVVFDPLRVRPIGTDPKLLVGDSSKARTLLNWRPQVVLEDGIRKTVEHYIQCGGWPYEAAVTISGAEKNTL